MIKRSNLLWVILVLFSITISYAGAIVVEWEKGYGGLGNDSAKTIKLLPDGGFIIGGITESFATYDSCDIWLIRLDSLGDTLWTKTYNGNYSELQIINDGGFIILGNRTLIRTDSEGNEIWSQPFGGYSCQETDDSGFIIIEHIDTVKSIKNRLIKTDFLGNIQWTHHLGDSCITYIDSIVWPDTVIYDTTWSSNYIPEIIIKKSDGSYTLGGYYIDKRYFADYNTRAMIIDLDSTFQIKWVSILPEQQGGDQFDKIYSLHQTNDGGFIAAGRAGVVPFWRLFLRLDSKGDTLWYKDARNDFVGEGQTGAYSIKQTNDGSFIAVGVYNRIGNLHVDWQACVHSIGTDGNTLWDGVLGLEGDYYKTVPDINARGHFDAAQSVILTEDGSFVMAGYSNSLNPNSNYNGPFDAWIIKFHYDPSVGDVIEPCYNIPGLSFYVNQNKSYINFIVLGLAIKKSFIVVDIFGLNGQVVKQIKFFSDDIKQMVRWDGKNNRGERVSSGMYIARIKIKDSVTSRKFVFQR